MQHLLITKLLVFQILITLYSTNILTSANPTPIVTDEVIDAICRNYKIEYNTTDCLLKMRTLKGRSLFPNPLAVLGTDYMENARNKSYQLMIWYNHMYLSKPLVGQSRLKRSYLTCREKYKEIYVSLTVAKKFMLSGNVVSMNSLVNAAETKVAPCERGFKNPPTVDVKKFLDANSKFKDMCIVLNQICETVRKLKSS